MFKLEKRQDFLDDFGSILASGPYIRSTIFSLSDCQHACPALLLLFDGGGGPSEAQHSRLGEIRFVPLGAGAPGNCHNVQEISQKFQGIPGALRSQGADMLRGFPCPA